MAPILGCLLLLGSSPATIVRAALLGPVTGGELGVTAEQNTRTQAAARSRILDRRLRYWLRLPLSGRVGTRVGLGYSFTLRPTAVRSFSSAGEPGLVLRQVDYDAGVRVTGIPAAVLSGSTARGRARADRSGIPLSESEVATRSGQFELAFRPLPLRAELTEHTNDQTWTISPLAPVLRQEEWSRTLRLSAQNSRTTLHYDRTQHEDRSAGFDYEAWNGRGAHTLRWGKASRLQSTVRRSQRDGASPYRQDGWEERLHVQHLRAFATDWSVLDSRTHGSSSALSSRAISGSFEHRVTQGLVWGAGQATYLTRTATLQSRATNRRIHATAERRWPSGWAARVGADAGIERREDRGEAAGYLTAIGEQHTVGVGRSFTLDSANPDSASVLVRGLDPPTPFIGGVDYTLEPTGDRLELRLTPLSRIQVGQRVEVDYRFRVGARPVARAVATRAHWVLERGGFSLRQERSTHENNLGRPDALVAAPNETETRSDVEGRWSVPHGTWSLRGGIATRRSPSFDQRATEVQSEWSTAWPPGARTTLAAAWVRRSSGRGPLDVWSADLRASWDASARLRLGTQWQTHSLARQGAPRERLIDGSVDVQARLAALEIGLRARQQWSHPSTRGGLQLLSAQIVRRF